MNMFQKIIDKQKAYFDSDATKSWAGRFMPNRSGRSSVYTAIPTTVSDNSSANASAPHGWGLTRESTRWDGLASRRRTTCTRRRRRCRRSIDTSVGPGQALSYKLGQLKIVELREKAEQQLVAH